MKVAVFAAQLTFHFRVKLQSPFFHLLIDLFPSNLS